LHEKVFESAEVGRKSDAQEPSFFSRKYSASDIQKGLVKQGPIPENANRAGLLDDEEPPAGVACVGDVRGLVDAAH
jgi:hypothetical protein